MNFTREQLESLATSFGELARASKRIRSVLLEVATTTQNVATPTEQEEKQEPGVQGEPDEDSEDSDSILEEDFCDTAMAMFTTRHFAWSKMAAERYFTRAVRQRLRANNLNFCWVHVGGDLESRANWKKISRRKAEEVYRKIGQGWDELCEFIRDQDTCPKGLRPSKWSRRQEVLACKMPDRLFQKKGFRSILIDNHDELPSLK